MPAVIEKEMEQAIQRPLPSLPVASVAGSALILASLFGLQFGLPWIWENFISGALGMAALIDRLAIVGLVGLGLAALIFAYPRIIPDVPGSRAGVAAGILFFIAGFVVVYLLSRLLDLVFVLLVNRSMVSPEFYQQRYVAGGPLAGIFAFLWLRWGWRLLCQEKNQKWLVRVEEQGWFGTGAYKPNQGRLMRRLVMITILILVACGMYHFWPLIQRGMTGNWAWPMPFMDGYNLVLAKMPGLVLTTIVALASLWFSYRAVNTPVFADFLIATSAEMQKVSWSNRQQIVRDTIVVLVVTALLATFLLLMDVFWVVLLRFFGVLQH